MKLLSIMIPYTPDRAKVLYELLSTLHSQIEKENAQDEVEILIELDNYEMSIGAKRQKLLERTTGEYVVAIDSDDEVGEDYISSIMEAIKHNPDVISFNGYMTTKGMNRENFKIMKDLPYMTISDAHGRNEYLRYNNHLSPIKREVALKIGYKDMKFAEDFDYAKRLKESGLIKTEYYINKDLYHYKYITDKR